MADSVHPHAELQLYLLPVILNVQLAQIPPELLQADVLPASDGMMKRDAISRRILH
jgi:hypothetical protein